jgi:hypothetical protein
MRAPSLRATLAVLTLVVPCAGAALVACSSSHGSNGGSADASEDSAAETGATDASQDHTTVPDGSGEASDASDAEAGPSDAGLDTAMGFADGSGFSGDCGVGPAGEPTDLQCTGLYSSWASKTVATDLTQYDPGLHLWSDGADKTRWIYLPAGQKIDTSDMDEWTFPVGTKIFKEFRLALGDASTETRIETRMLWKQAANTWYRTTYLWTPDGVTDAVELTSGELDAAGTGYEVPNQDECNQCHNGRIDGVLGFEAVALSSPEASGMTIETLTTNGLITDPPDAALTIPGDPTESAALAYLHMNCGTSCHNRGNGQAEPTKFFMRLDVATLSTVQTTDTYTTGWGVPTVNFNIPFVTTTYRLLACNTGSSCVYYRASHRDNVDGTPFGVQMPPIDTHKVDEAGITTIAAWINQGCEGGTDAGSDTGAD